MTIQDALNTAVAGGYHVQGSDGGVTVYSGAKSDFTLWTRTDNASSFMIPLEETLLDPAFWTAFGRALAREGGLQSGDWKQLWHHFTEHLIQGGTPAAFFQTLAAPSSPASPRRGKARSRRHQAETRVTGTRRTHRGGLPALEGDTCARSSS